MKIGFTEWLKAQPYDDQELTELKTFIDLNAKEWPTTSNDLGAYASVIATKAPPKAAQLTTTLSEYFLRWRNAMTPNFSLGQIAIIACGVILAGFVLLGLFIPSFFNSLGNTEQVRGMVTFLFVLATIVVVILVAGGIFWVGSVDEVQKRFAAAKDLITIIVGIVGTIMGFYFGTTTTTQNLSIGSAAVTPITAKAGTPVTIAAAISGGAKPYSYTIAISSPTSGLPSDQLAALGERAGKSEDGKINKAVTVPATVPNSGVFFFLMTVTDGKGVSAQNSGAFFIEK